MRAKGKGEASGTPQQASSCQHSSRSASEVFRSRSDPNLVMLRQDGRAREVHEAHIARLAAESKLAEAQARLTSTSSTASQQASRERPTGPVNCKSLLTGP